MDGVMTSPVIRLPAVVSSVISGLHYRMQGQDVKLLVMIMISVEGSG